MLEYLQAIKTHLKYNEATGDITVIKKYNRKKNIGDKVFFSNDKDGYKIGSFLGREFKAHRIAWFLYYGIWPEFIIDHIDRNPSNNKISNLRAATKSLNALNSKLRIDSSSKHTGVSWKKDKKKWKSYITIDGKQKHLGYYDDIEGAILARSLFKSDKKIK